MFRLRGQYSNITLMRSLIHQFLNNNIPVIDRLHSIPGYVCEIWPCYVQNMSDSPPFRDLYVNSCQLMLDSVRFYICVNASL